MERERMGRGLGETEGREVLEEGEVCLEVE